MAATNVQRFSGDVLLSGEMNLRQVSNVASLKVNSNVVTEFPRSKKLIRYPRVALTQNDESATSGYVASASVDDSSNDRVAWKAFNSVYPHSLLTDFWFSGSSGNYNGGTTGREYDGTTNLGSDSGRTATDSGEWLQINLPNKIQLTEFKVWGQPNTINNYPAGGVLYARNTTNEDWTELHAFDETHISASNTNYTHELTITPSYYNTYALVIKKVSQSNPGNTGVSVGELELFGIPEYDPDAAGMDVKVTSYPNVPNTDWLEVYYDAKDFSGTPTSITDKSGNNITATANNITIDATYNSFEFTESPKSNIIADNVSFVSGDESHSIVLWVRLKNGNSNNLLFDYRVAGGTSITGAATGLYIVNNNTRLQFFHQDTDKQIDFNFEQNRWYHITGTYAGGGGFTGSKIYIDGVDLGGIKSGSDSVLVLPTTGTITIGDYLYSSIGLGDGSIANFRLFNRAITSDEVWQLYSYQKEYFGHGDLGMTLKAGRLGIGTSEPRAALDVRGDINVQGTITTFRHPYEPSYTLSTISPDIWAIAGESTARIGGGAISYTSGVSIKYHNGVPMWFFGSRDENVDILNTINHTTNTWSVAIAIAKKPESSGAFFNQITNNESYTGVNHRFSWGGNFSVDEFPNSQNGGNTGASYITIPDESVVFIKKTGTGTNQVYVYVNGGLVGQATNAETYAGSTPTKIRLGHRTRFSGYSPETPLHAGFAAVAVWDSAINFSDMSKYITYQSLTAK
jgi:hypothetical protein